MYNILYYIQRYILHYIYCAKLLQSCLTLCDSMDCSPPGSSVHGILQARTLEWVVMPSFQILLQGIFPTQGSIRPRSPTLQADSLLSATRVAYNILILLHIK